MNLGNRSATHANRPLDREVPAYFNQNRQECVPAGMRSSLSVLWPGARAQVAHVPDIPSTPIQLFATSASTSLPASLTWRSFSKALGRLSGLVILKVSNNISASPY